MSAAEDSGRAWLLFLQQPECHALIGSLSWRHGRRWCGGGLDNNTVNVVEPVLLDRRRQSEWYSLLYGGRDGPLGRLKAAASSPPVRMASWTLPLRRPRFRYRAWRSALSSLKVRRSDRAVLTALDQNDHSAQCPCICESTCRPSSAHSARALTIITPVALQPRTRSRPESRNAPIT